MLILTGQVVHPRILSRFFWPPLRDEQFRLPPHITAQFTSYETEYAKIKRGRKLAWLDHLGSIELDIHLEDRTVSIEASPIQAAVLYAFQERERMTLADVVASLESSVAGVRRAVMFWVLHGMLKEVEVDTFCVLEQAETARPNQSIPLLMQ